MDNCKEITQKLSHFLTASPSRFHAAANVCQMLEEAGFEALSEGEPWLLLPGHSYFVMRGGSSLIAFRLPRKAPSHFQIIASHTDSPCFKIKESPEFSRGGLYTQLNVEQYGGALRAPWFDRPLGIAGRLIVEENGAFRPLLFDTRRPVALIPSLAIHMNRSANESAAFPVQASMQPLFGGCEAAGSFSKLLSEAAGTEPDRIAGSDLYLYDCSAPSVWGVNKEFFSGRCLDNLQNVFASVTALLQAPAQERSVSMCCLFDHEEVGSRSMQGADSTFFRDTLERICLSLSLSREEERILLSRSFQLSADNGHAAHPNFLDKADPVNRPVLNGGVLIKHSANQKYTTDALSAAIFRAICKKAGVPTQEFTNHSDIPGGSTLGNISLSHVSVPSIDIGCPLLAMHSPCETTGMRDTAYMTAAMQAFYQTCLSKAPDGSIRI